MNKRKSQGFHVPEYGFLPPCRQQAGALRLALELVACIAGFGILFLVAIWIYAYWFALAGW